MEAAAQVLAPSSASLIFLLRSYSVRSLPSKLFLYKYSRRSRAFLRIMLHLAPVVQRSKRRNCLGIVPDRWGFLRRGQTVHPLLGGQPSKGSGACHRHVHTNIRRTATADHRCVHSPCFHG